MKNEAVFNVLLIPLGIETHTHLYVWKYREALLLYDGGQKSHTAVLARKMQRRAWPSYRRLRCCPSVKLEKPPLYNVPLICESSPSLSRYNSRLMGLNQGAAQAVIIPLKTRRGSGRHGNDPYR